MTGLSFVKSTSKSRSLRPCGCSLAGWSFIRSTTLITRIFTSGTCWRRMSTAASVSSVGTSPQHAITTSGSLPLSLLAHSQMPRPAVQCSIACSMVSHAQQAVRVRRKVDANHLGLLVHDVVDEPGILMAEAVVVLPPDVGRQEVVERRNRPAPGNLVTHLQPLGVLVEHRIDDVNERLVAAEEAVAAGQQVSLEPALALVLAEHLHHAPVGTQ